jgi:sulfide dehydrogenase cytochrome subunit
MQNSCLSVIAIATWLTLISPVQVIADDMTMMCISCHGEDGRGVESDTPIIAGLPADNQKDALLAYASGDRICSAKPMMCKLASFLTEEQVTSISTLYAAMPYLSAGEDFDAALAEKGNTIHQANCAVCHGVDGPSDEGFGILHGQRKDYLRVAMQQYAAGERKQLPDMAEKTNKLSSDDIEALLNYYASYRN